MNNMLGRSNKHQVFVKETIPKTSSETTLNSSEVSMGKGVVQHYKRGEDKVKGVCCGLSWLEGVVTPPLPPLLLLVLSNHCISDHFSLSKSLK